METSGRVGVGVDPPAPVVDGDPGSSGGGGDDPGNVVEVGDGSLPGIEPEAVPMTASSRRSANSRGASCVRYTTEALPA
jgi:hypothetical protein